MVSIIFTEKYTQVVLGIISRQMVGEAVAVKKLLDMNCNEKYLNELKKSMKLNIDIINNARLRKIGISKSHKTYRMLRNALIKRGYEEYYVNTYNDKMEIYIPSKNENDVYKISFSRKNLYMKIIWIVLGSGVASSILLLVISLIFLKNQIRPIKRLAKAATEFGKGIDVDKYVPEGAKEIRIAGAAFCEMKQNIKALINNRIKALAGISHDLKTPLTKMKLQLSMMPKTKEVEWLTNDVNSMISMTESFTLHAAEQSREVFSRINLSLFLSETARDYASDNFKIHLSGDKTIDASIKQTSFKRALGNIISNAKKYSNNLYVTFSKENNFVIINFEDDGPGIDEETAEDLFTPFVRRNQARTHGIDGGVGLGLSIARDAALSHGGKIAASNSQTYGGACFTVTLPFIS
ncbi:MAG: hypothetical protein LBM19_03965 [Holosporales bacterium]|nr:hypothetical protein [Holosporales bacterium]